MKFSPWPKPKISGLSFLTPIYGTLHGFQEAALLLVIVFDQVGHDLRVRFGRELLAVSGKEFLQRQIVFNDAVVHQADFFV